MHKVFTCPNNLSSICILHVYMFTDKRDLILIKVKINCC